MGFRRNGGRLESAVEMPLAHLQGIVHDMRRPLVAIDAVVAAAETEAAVPPQVRRRLDQIKEQVRELQELCSRVLLPAAAQWEHVVLYDLVDQAARGATMAYGTPIEVAATPATVMGDEVNLRRAVANLLDNACRVSGTANVRVVVRATSDEVRIEVVDAGPGFGRGPSGSASLGLSIVEAVAREHGGRLEAEAAEGGGASVALVLPMAAAAAGDRWATRAAL